MYIEIEPTGTKERNGLVQIRLCMYLESDDARYKDHYVDVPARELTKEEYANPILASLVPKVKQNNPFHNHFIYVPHDATNDQIMSMAEDIARVAYDSWKNNRPISIQNAKINSNVDIDVYKSRDRVEQLVSDKLKRTVTL